ncbi:MAG: cation-translocating P-type ATPase [Faecalibacterium sp.]|nr:cation-translocating P-type ATPase [Ruminococcus sp.]MCM1391490.1 cation-translocating P-type ATPase [Ruminococcus sp.]MCM1485252.1 cation-translocating P-type ATPase [Faecalibacterium sp.]
MKYYLQTVDETFESVQSSPNGITENDAAARLEKNGKNKLKEGQKTSMISRFLNQLKDPMIIILIIAAVISAITGFFEAKAAGETFIPTDTIIIMVVVIINAVLGVLQESKAEAAIEALQEMSAATSKVIRDGKQISVKSEDLVVGDVVVLEAGDAVPADCRIFECASMKIEEAALTGESVPVNKVLELANVKDNGDVPLGDRKNMAYMGSTVVYGRGKAVVVATGMDTEMGKIADAIAKAEDNETPLQKKLNQLSKVLTWLVLGICVFIFAFQIIMTIVRGESLSFDLALSVFMTAVSLAVAAIPEGLAAVVTIVLSIGVTNMSKKNAIIRKLTAVETLGCAQIICSDKTGTLTQNKMTVVDHYGDDENLIAKAMALCCDADIDENGEVIGEPTEAALVNYANKLGMNKRNLVAECPRIGEAPFDSGRKMMSTVHQTSEGIVQYTKGAPDEILKKCTHALINGQIVEFTQDIRNEVLKSNKAMADKALRVLAVSMRKYDAAPSDFSPEALENDLVFVGLTGMIDPVRPEVKAAIEECRKAGITPIMITGDHKDTAVAIATELGIIDDPSHAITGAELNEISDEDFAEKVTQYFVYARVQPEHKTRIVNAWKARGMITAMTGDGVNDAPSIKSADIGIGMGITGTDVTKNVADMVLADDNFATIVGAVSEGRRIYDNIRKAIQFLLGSNLAEVLSIFVSSMLNFTILRPPHLLFINLVTDCFPALALGLEKPENNLMQRQPRKSDDGIFAGGMGIDCLYQGVLVTLLTLAAFFIGEYRDAGHWAFMNIADCAEGMTMAFLTMSMCEIFHSFNMRSQRGSVLAMSIKYKSHNKALYLSMIASLVLTTALIEVPFLADAFGFTRLGGVDYAISIGLAISIIPIVEIIKLIQRAITKSKNK